MKKILLIIFFLHFLVLQIFADTKIEVSSTNWSDFLLKSVNFLILISAIWFFFGKKIINYLNKVVQNEQEYFFSLESKKKTLEKTLLELKKNIELEKEKTKKNEELYFQQVDLEKEKIKKESIAYSQKIEKNNSIILEQEKKEAKQKLYKKIFSRTLEKLEKAIKNKKIIISEEKYLSKFFQGLENSTK